MTEPCSMYNSTKYSDVSLRDLHILQSSRVKMDLMRPQTCPHNTTREASVLSSCVHFSAFLMTGPSSVATDSSTTSPRGLRHISDALTPSSSSESPFPSPPPALRCPGPAGPALGGCGGTEPLGSAEPLGSTELLGSHWGAPSLWGAQSR